ncbi:MAG: DNA polymerase/3'-5' exonuclease PolX [Actinomycetota bacterium]|nr:DNA polymerase/3'-5' exonuclease PolX [Actinomycetota bacterium]
MPKTNEDVAELLDEMAELLAISGYDPFRVRAYEKAARAVAAYAKDIDGMDDAGILAIPTIGKGMAVRIREYLDTGAMHELEELRAQIPAGMRELIHIPGLGPKKARIIAEELNISTVEELIAAIGEHKLKDIKGLGLKTEENILRGIEQLRQHGDRIRVDIALALAEELMEGLKSCSAVIDIATAGSLRRMQETIGDIDILASSKDANGVMEAFLELEMVGRTIARGDTKCSVLTLRGMQVDLRVVPPEAWGAALIYFTGSKAHNVKIRGLALKKKLTLNEYGLFKLDTKTRVAARTEEVVYKRLGMPWIPPPLREDGGEVEAAAGGTLPALIAEDHLKGDLHTHTNLTDGQAPIEEMVDAAAKRGLEYYAVTDHAEGLPMMRVTREKLLAQRKIIDALQKKYPSMTLLHGMELNIDKAGNVDYDVDTLARFDWLNASVHGLFNLTREEQTKRIIAAMENPHVHAIGHPTGRQIGRRQPIDFDPEAVFAAAVRTGTALEINCFPDRQDLKSDHVRRAREHGVTFTISTDAHSVNHFRNVRYGIAIAQRGWLEPSMVLNCKPLSELKEFVARKRAR